MESWPVRPRHILTFLAIVVAVILIINFNQRAVELAALEDAHALISVQGTEVMQTQEALIARVAYAHSTQAVLDWAYVDGHWGLPSDKFIVYVPYGAEDANPQPAVTPEPTPQPAWMIWWELFFGD